MLEECRLYCGPTGSGSSSIRVIDQNRFMFMSREGTPSQKCGWNPSDCRIVAGCFSFLSDAIGWLLRDNCFLYHKLQDCSDA